MPEVLGDRAMDTWEPLFGIADAAGGDWPDRARSAAVTLMAADPDEDGIGIQLLADIRKAFGDAQDLPTSELISRLASRDDRPWATWSRGKTMTGNALARQLRPFGIRPAGPVRFGEKVERAYARHAFEDAWARYMALLKFMWVSKSAKRLPRALNAWVL